eukprot:Rhum_TRINITY_DN14317_c0_g1::Rhum_TRINITY_DN14317_c0_g1_i1::g.80298::m.80298
MSMRVTSFEGASASAAARRRRDGAADLDEEQVDERLQDSEGEAGGRPGGSGDAELFFGYNVEQILTASFLVLHFLSPLLCLVVCVTWLRTHDGDGPGDVGATRAVVYRLFTGIACASYLLMTSVFYMWSLRADDAKIVGKRRVRGLILNLLFSDLPLFSVTADMVIGDGISGGLLIMQFSVTTLAFIYSAMRVWIFYMTRTIKAGQGEVGSGVLVGEGGAYSPHAYQPVRAGSPVPVPPPPHQSGYAQSGGGFPAAQAAAAVPHPQQPHAPPAFMLGNNDDLYADASPAPSPAAVAAAPAAVGGGSQPAFMLGNNDDLYSTEALAQQRWAR